MASFRETRRHALPYRDIAREQRGIGRGAAARLTSPIEICVDWASSGLADRYAHIPGVQRRHPRMVAGTIHDPRDVHNWPDANWNPEP